MLPTAPLCSPPVVLVVALRGSTREGHQQDNPSQVGESGLDNKH